MQKNWFSSWFDTPYYHILYKNRDYNEACFFIDNVITFLNLQKDVRCWDLCCGKGRHSVYLNKRGFKVIGTDLSETSISYATQYANANLEFYQHDMRQLFRINYFDVVFNLFTSFGYFDRQEEDLRVYQSVQRALKTNGFFVFDYLNSVYVEKNYKPFDVSVIDGIEFKITKEINDMTIIKNIDFTDNNQEFHFEERVKLYNRSYFEKLAKQSNLVIKHIFGDYNLNSFDPTSSPRLILILQKI